MEDSNSSICGSPCCGVLCRKKKPSENLERNNLEQSAEENKAVFSGDLPQPLNTGHCIDIIGAPLDFCTRFSINLTCGKNENSDIAFHFNPRLEQKYVVRNSRHNGLWGTEETVSCYEFKLPRKTKFKLSIFIAPKEFMVAINDKHFCTFKFRISLNKVKFIHVYGDVTIEDVDVKETDKYPAKAVDVISVPLEDSFKNEEQLLNPFIGQLPDSFQVGWQLEIFGKVKLLPHSFYVNLQDGNQYWPHPIIPLHLNTRFNTLVNAHSLIRNAWINGSWGMEERTPAFHFIPGRNFHLTIRMETDYFSVWVDGKLEGEFKFRITNTQINTVYIQGDLFLYKVFVNTKGNNMLMQSKLI